MSKIKIFRNDIIYLSRYAPIRTRSGANGGIFMMENYHNKLFRYLSYDEEKLLTSIMSTLDMPERNIVSNIKGFFIVRIVRCCQPFGVLMRELLRELIKNKVSA